MAGSPAGAEGFELVGTLRPLGVINNTYDAVNFDPAGGSQSVACNQNVAEGSRDYRIGMFVTTVSHGPGGTYKRLGLGFAYRAGGTPAAGLAFGVCQFAFLAGGGTLQVRNLCLNDALELEWYDGGTTTQGTATGDATPALASTTGWQWVWIDCHYPTAGGTITLLTYINGDLASTHSFTSTGGASATIAPALFGPSGTTPSSITGNIDNAIMVSNIDGSERGGMQWRCAVVKVTVDGDGASNDFTASAGSRFQCVDETVPNDDTDYVSVDTTAAARQMFAMTSPVAPSGYEKPLFVHPFIRHRNGDAGKWAGSHTIRVSLNGGQNVTVPLLDPGASYFREFGQYPSQYGSGGYYLTPGDLPGLECGVDLTADGSNTAEWRVTAVQAEVSYVRYFHQERVRFRGVARGVARGLR